MFEQYTMHNSAWTLLSWVELTEFKLINLSGVHDISKDFNHCGI